MTEERIMTLRLDGRFDAYQAPQVKTWLKEQVNIARENHLPACIVVDMQKVHFIDSAGLSALVVGLKQTRETGGTFNLFGLQQPVQIILELSWLDKAFPIFDSEEAARTHAAGLMVTTYAG